MPNDRMKHATCAIVLAFFAASASGCSFFLVDRYHAPRPPSTTASCTTRYKWPLIDAAVAIVAYGTSFYLSRYGGYDVPAYTGNVVGGIGVGFGVSTGYGLWNVHHCREEIAGHGEAEASPGTEPAPPVTTEAAPTAAPEAPPPAAADDDQAPVAAEEQAPAASEEPKPAPRKKKHKKARKPRKSGD
jgi:hypothetical protein